MEREDPAVKGGRIGGKIGGPKGGRASLESPKVSAAQIQLYLKNVDYPVTKNELIQQAKTNGATENVLDFLGHLPEKTYNRANDVEHEFGKVKSLIKEHCENP